MKNAFILSLAVLVLLGLAFAAWQSGSDAPDSGWQKPEIQAHAASPTLTLTPGWWETPVQRPVVPTMPRKTNITPTITPASEKPTP